MISNDTQKIQEAVISEIKSGLEVVNPALDALSREQLLDLVKSLSSVQMAENVLNKTDNGPDKEVQVLIENIFALQEAVLGYIQLNFELNGGSNGQH